jgi:hypothetical protein
VLKEGYIAPSGKPLHDPNTFRQPETQPAGLQQVMDMPQNQNKAVENHLEGETEKQRKALRQQMTS